MPACDASITIAPVPFIVQTLPTKDAAPETILKLTAKPDDAVARSEKGAAPELTSAIGLKVMDWFAATAIAP